MSKIQLGQSPLELNCFNKGSLLRALIALQRRAFRRLSRSPLSQRLCGSEEMRDLMKVQESR